MILMTFQVITVSEHFGDAWELYNVDESLYCVATDIETVALLNAVGEASDDYTWAVVQQLMPPAPDDDGGGGDGGDPGAGGGDGW